MVRGICWSLSSGLMQLVGLMQVTNRIAAANTTVVWLNTQALNSLFIFSFAVMIVVNVFSENAGCMTQRRITCHD